MVEQRWPAGIRPWGEGIQIRLWKDGQEIYSETVSGDPYKPSDLASAVRRRNELKSRLTLGFSFHDSDQPGMVTLFRDDAQDYIETLDVDYSTALSYHNILNKHWLPVLGGEVTQFITSQAINNIIKGMDVSRKTKRNNLVPLRGIFRHKHIEPNPTDSIHIKKDQKAEIDRFRPDDRSTIIDYLSKKNDAQVVAYFALFFGTGMRPGELLGLEYSDLDLKERKVHVHQQTVRRRHKASTKTHMRRTVTIPAWVIPFISNLPSQFKYGHVFLNNLGTKCLDTDLFNDAWNNMFDDPKFRRDHNIRKRRPYTCRHSRAAELLTMGVKPAKAARQLGHSVEMFFGTYSEWIDEFQGDDDDHLLEGVGISPVTDRSQKPEIK
jgi:integrase|tara:strand:- start:118 stop:1254 length:1137 start_codon:yes stop_codon:yes gene_type:complete